MARKTTKPTAELDRIMADLPTIIAHVGVRLDATTTHMQALKKAGLIYATEWWRKDRKTPSLYLLYPSHVGEKRRRDYVGNDPGAVEDARAGIQRAKEFDGLAVERRQLEARLEQAADALKRATHILTGRW